jgi:hypothetical protein
MLLVVNAPKAFQRKLVNVVERSTTHHAKTDQPGQTAFRSFEIRFDQAPAFRFLR